MHFIAVGANPDSGTSARGRPWHVSQLIGLFVDSLTKRKSGLEESDPETAARIGCIE